MQGAFVRALGAVFHLNCFKCMVRLFFAPFTSLWFMIVPLYLRIAEMWSPPNFSLSKARVESNTHYASGITSGV